MAYRSRGRKSSRGRNSGNFRKSGRRAQRGRARSAGRGTTVRIVVEPGHGATAGSGVGFTPTSAGMIATKVAPAPKRSKF